MKVQPPDTCMLYSTYPVNQVLTRFLLYPRVGSFDAELAAVTMVVRRSILAEVQNLSSYRCCRLLDGLYRDLHGSVSYE